MSSIQVLFLHHLDHTNVEVVKSNFNSFLKSGNDIVAIRDEDQDGLPGSYPVSINGLIPRGSRRWATDTVLLNYILENKHNLKHNFYMFCEYDCYCECNIETYYESYLNFDICAPHIITQKDEKDWGWFKEINLPCSLIGLRPSVFIVFSKKAILEIAAQYCILWDKIKNSNSEARLGSVASLLGIQIGRFKDLNFNVSWGKTKFKRNNKLYHPVKNKFSSSQIIPEPQTSNFAGIWDMGRINENKFATLILQTDGTIENYKNYNEVYWSSMNNELILYSGRGAVTSKFKNVYTDGEKYYGDYYDGNIDGEKILVPNLHWIKKIII